MSDLSPQRLVELDLPPSISRALESPARTVGIFGPSGTAKTTSVCVYVYTHCKKYAPMFPGSTVRWLFLRDTYESIRSTILKSWLDTFPPPKFGKWNEQKKEFNIRLPAGLKAEVLFFGLDDEKDKQKLQSLNLTGWVMEEPAGGIDLSGRVSPGIPETVYKMLLTRDRHPVGCPRLRRILVGNPPSTAHWVRRLIWHRANVDHDPEVTCVDVPTTESPLYKVDHAYYDRLERDLGAGSPEARRFARGEWLPALSGGFHRSMVPRMPRGKMPPFSAVVATLDPATGSNSGDRSAHVVAGLTETGFAYVIDLGVGRWRSKETIDRIFEVQRRHGPGVQGIESVAFQAWIEELVKEKQNEKGISVPTHALTRNSKVTKEMRIQGALGHRLAEGRLIIAEDLPHQGEFFEELEDFPEGTHDDILDAMSDIDQVASLAHPAVAGTRDSLHVESDEPPQVSRRFWGHQGRFWKGAA